MVQRRRAKGQALPDRAYKCLWSFLSPFETIIGCSNPEFNPHWGFKCDSGSRGSLVVHDRRALRDQPRDESRACGRGARSPRYGPEGRSDRARAVAPTDWLRRRHGCGFSAASSPRGVAWRGRKSRPPVIKTVASSPARLLDTREGRSSASAGVVLAGPLGGLRQRPAPRSYRKQAPRFRRAEN